MKSKLFLILIILFMTASFTSVSYLADTISPDDNKVKNLNFVRDDLNAEEIATLESFRKLDGSDAYFVNFTADYHFDEYLKVGGYPNGIHGSRATCSSFAAFTPEGDTLHCYNQDGLGVINPDYSLVTMTNPEGGFRSISQVRSDHAISHKFYQQPENINNRNGVLGAPFCPFDGMNEFGLCISVMSVNGDPMTNPGKIAVSPLATSRLILDYARNVEEALDMMDDYNNMGANQQHFLLSDADGNSAIVEYFRGDMVVTRAIKKHQVLTNFPIDGYGSVFDKEKVKDPFDRYQRADKTLDENQSTLTMDQALALVKSLSINNRVQITSWSALYNKSKGILTAYYHYDYKTPQVFEIPMAVDLKIDSISKNKLNLKRGKKVNFKINVLNDSPRYSKEGKVSLYLSRKNTIYKKSIKLATVELKALKAREQHSLKIKSMIPKELKAKDYYLIARIEDLPNRDTNPANDTLVSSETYTLQ